MAVEIITAARLRELFDYDPLTGVFTRRVSAGTRWHAGDVAGGPNADGYIVIRIAGRNYYAHRLAWLYVHGEWPSAQIDHRFDDRGDNRLSELRPATRGQNAQNQRRAQANNKCGLLGVSESYGRFRSQIQRDEKNKHLGTFDTPELAHAAYLEAKAKLHPFQTLVEMLP